MSAFWSGVALSCLGLALSGCGGSDNDDGGGHGSSLSQATIQTYEGSYELTAFTHNAAGCESDGASTLAAKQERSFVMVGAEALGSAYVNLDSCADAAECGAVVSAIRARGSYSAEYALILSTEAGLDELGGFSAMSGGLVSGVCTRRKYVAITLTREGDAVRVESRSIPLADAPPEDGICWAEPAKQRAEAEGRPCSELEVISGRKVGPLP